jgi:HD-GYP domain-containing protein (c-di-GMP phosphodiesterase class II)
MAMQVVTATRGQIASPRRPEDDAVWLAEVRAELVKFFGVEFTILLGATGEVVEFADGEQSRDWPLWAEVCREVSRRGTAEFIADEDPLLLLAVPISSTKTLSYVAVGAFVQRQPTAVERIHGVAQLLGMTEPAARKWLARQECWTAAGLLRSTNLLVQHLSAVHRLETLEKEVDNLSLHLSTTYEEISLLYRLTQNLKLSSKADDLGRMAVEWLAEVVPAETIVIQLLPTREHTEVVLDARSKPVLLTHGPILVDCEGFSQLVEHLELNKSLKPCVVNQPATSAASWPLPALRELILVPLAEGDNVFGWLAAFNHTDGGEFGTVEASLLSSVGAILGIHSGNTDLYRQQADFLAGMVRALTSAIDAKDPYTCGHSDRVARVAVRLAQELGLSAELINTIYMSGLLHDVGKIGIDDQVLRKPGALTPAEYEHIKTHAEIGHRILKDLKQLDPVLPVVLHHHEQWDGKGYPHGLVGEATPLLARIVAVADSFDAMSSDRPYRKGMPDEKLDAILRSGAGQQWDAAVVDAFFRARKDIREISRLESEALKLDVQQWV